MAKFTHDLTLPTLFSFAELTLFGLKTFKKQEAPRLALLNSRENFHNRFSDVFREYRNGTFA